MKIVRSRGSCACDRAVTWFYCGSDAHEPIRGSKSDEPSKEVLFWKEQATRARLLTWTDVPLDGSDFKSVGIFVHLHRGRPGLSRVTQMQRTSHGMFEVLCST